MAKPGMKHWLITHFVPIAEVIGYMISLSVIGFALVGLFVQVDVTVGASGALAPVSEKVRTGEGKIVVDYLIQSGTEVEAGEPVLVMVESAEDIRRVKALRTLERARGFLDGSDPGVGGALDAELSSVLERIPGPSSTVTLEAPLSGVFVTYQDIDDVAVAQEDDPVCAFFDVTRLELLADVTQDQKDSQKQREDQKKRPAPGQEARLKIPESDVRLVGKVVEAEEGEGNAFSLRIVFEDVPGEIADKYRERVREGEDMPTRSVKIVTGRQSLSGKLFGR